MDNTKEGEKNRTTGWGKYFIIALLVSVVSIAVLLYIGWIDNNTHIDSRNGDNVLSNYQTVTPQPNAPAINDWNNPDGNSLREIIVDHATGTNTTPLPE